MQVAHLVIKSLSIVILLSFQLIASNIQEEAKILDIAKSNFESALQNYNRTVRTCYQNSKELSSELFKNIYLTQKEWEIALIPLSIKAEEECEADAKYEIYISASIYRKISKELDIEPTGRVLNFTEDWYIYNKSKYISANLKFLDLSSEKRKKIKNIKQLQYPFDPILTLENIKKAHLMTPN